MKANHNSLDYWQGFFDAWRIMRNRWSRVAGEPNIDIEEIYDQIIRPVREQEIIVYENLKEKYGDRFQVSPFGDGQVEEE